MIKHLLPAAVALAGTLAFTAPVQAQSGGTLIIYGNDKCPANTICVRAPESERYRIPESLRTGPLSATQESWSARGKSVEQTGASVVGNGSCSSNGPGGWTGCWSKMMKDSKAANNQARAAEAASPLPK